MEGPLSGTVTIPVPGGKKVHIKKIYAVGGVAVVGIAALLWYRNRKASSTAAAPVTDPTMATDPAGNVGVIDPSTGFVEGSPEDLAALSTGTNSGGSGSGSSGGGSDTGNVATQVTNGPPFGDNSAWAQYATAYLIGTLDQDPGAVATDIAAYLAGAPVVQAQVDVIRQAEAFAGPPPQTGPNGYPPSINVTGTVSGTGSAPGAVTLSQGVVTSTSIKLNFPAVTGATSYAYTATASGYSKGGATSPGTFSLTGLKPSNTYTIAVHAVNAAGSGPASTIVVTTPAGATATPPKTTTPAAPAATYSAVKVVKFTTSNPPWNSTISGIAAHYGWGSDWESVWSDPKNASLRAKRKSANLIQAGDTVYVKKK